MARKRKSGPRRRSDLESTSKSRQSSQTAYGKKFNPDYTYVINDLRRIGVLSVIFIMGMVILSLIL